MKKMTTKKESKPASIKKPFWNSFCRHRKCRGFTNSSAAKSLFYFLWTSLPFPPTYHPLNVYCLLFVQFPEIKQQQGSMTHRTCAKANNKILPFVSFTNRNAHKIVNGSLRLTSLLTYFYQLKAIKYNTNK